MDGDRSPRGGGAGGSHDRAGSFRPDLQGLRAIAVLSVLVYHLWPRLLPGGYIGVDVFFVISGYLITSLLFRELERTGSLSFAGFYARRVRRLLPASLLTLVVVLAAAYLLLPSIRWRTTADEVAASTVYSENWWLAAKAVDYLALDATPSPTQHFWSLSLEEQFYLGWPLLLFAVYRLAGYRAGRAGAARVCAGFLGIVIASSFAWSVYGGIAGRPSAYFSTFTRVWQLASGGALAIWDRSNEDRSKKGHRAGALVLGLTAIAVSALILSNETSYPGFAAALPTVGAVLAIHGGRSHGGSALTRWLAARPVQYIGDISYSLYLWHWPLIIFAEALRKGELGAGDRLAVLLASIALASVSKRVVEDPFRISPARPQRRRVVLATAAAASGTCVAFALMLHQAAARPQARTRAAPEQYPGAAVMLRQVPLPAPRPDFLPALVDVEDDVASAYAEGCIQKPPATDVRTCVYGKPGARTRIAVIGDSHAVQWLPAFQVLADQLDLQVVGITMTSCSFSHVVVYNRILKRGYTECAAWSQHVLEYLAAQKFDYVVITQSPRHYIDGLRSQGLEENAAKLAAGLAQIWREVAATGSKVVVLRATPWHPAVVAECVASHRPPFDGCTGPPSRVLFRDAMVQAAEASGTRLLDFTDLFCRDGRCPPIIGNVFVYRDAHHVTATYMRTLAPMLRERLGL